MKVRNFSDFSSFCKDVIDNMESVKQTISIACFYEDAVEIVKGLSKYDKVRLFSIELRDFMWDGYDNEYYITLSKDEEGDYLLYCEKAYVKEKDIYFFVECDIAYIAEDCSSRIIKRMSSNVFYETRFFDDEEDFCSCEKCADKLKIGEIEIDEDMKGFTVSTSDDYGYSSFSFHATDENFVKEILKLYKKF
jgi:hypothetical protein